MVQEEFHDPLLTALDELGTRPRRREDDALLFELFAESRRRELEGAPWSDGEKQAFLESQFAAQQSHYDRVFAEGLHRIFENEREAFGRILLYRDRDGLLLVDVAILPPYRNRGLGGRIMAALKDEATRTGQALRLTVYEGNRAAKRFYERHAFRPTDGNGVYVRYAWCPEGWTGDEEAPGSGLIPRLG